MAEPWPEDVRSRAIVRAAEVGAEGAAEETGVPAGTIRQWISRLTAQVKPFVRPEVVDTSVPWSRRQLMLAAECSIAAAEALAFVRQCIADRKANDLQRAAIAFGILSEKTLLLNGEATARSEAAVWTHRTTGASGNVEEQIADLERRLGIAQGNGGPPCE